MNRCSVVAVDLLVREHRVPEFTVRHPDTVADAQSAGRRIMCTKVFSAHATSRASGMATPCSFASGSASAAYVRERRRQTAEGNAS